MGVVDDESQMLGEKSFENHHSHENNAGYSNMETILWTQTISHQISM